MHNLFNCPKTNQPRTFESITHFSKWRKQRLAFKRKQFEDKLTPLQYFVTQGFGNERAFTGEHHWTKDVGIYECRCCTQRLFMSDHKYETKSGFPAFWHNIQKSINFTTDHLKAPKVGNAFVDPTLKYKEPIQRIVCSNCESHLGHAFTDGPAPFFKRFMVNSAAIVFVPKPWFEMPEDRKITRARNRFKLLQKKGQRRYNNFLKLEQECRVPSYEERLKKMKGVEKKQLNLQRPKIPKVKSEQTEGREVHFDVKGNLIQQ